MAQRVENLTDNIWFTFGKNMVDSDGQYLTYAISKMVKNMSEMFDGTIFKPVAKVIGLFADIADGVNKAWTLVETVQDAIKSLENGKIINADNLGSWNGVAMLSRGKNYLGISPADIIGAETNVLSASGTISMPSPVIGGSGSTGSEIESFESVEQAVKETAQDISSVSEETTATLDKLYDTLFESQSKPIKISIENASEDFLKLLNLLINNNTNLLSRDIESYLNNSNFVDQLINTLYSVRGM